MNMASAIDAIDFLAGATLLVDKPAGWTSYDVVNKLRFALRRRLGMKNIKVGHAGTLDPMATGLLVVCTGKATKQLHAFQQHDKEYTGAMTFGATTPSYDAETPIDAHFPTAHLSEELLVQTRLQFLGEIQQLPPPFSAIKVDGQPLYQRARRGEEVTLKPRQVRIDEFVFTYIRLPRAGFRVYCAKGTYIRSLAHDFGKAVGSGAYLSELRRTRSGEFHVDDAWSLPALIAALSGQAS
jgi:tRNA pseudouridine55 synthase